MKQRQRRDTISYLEGLSVCGGGGNLKLKTDIKKKKRSKSACGQFQMENRSFQAT